MENAKLSSHGGQTFQEVLDEIKLYISKPEDIEFVTRAFNFASLKHQGQFRKSGEPYINHCLAVTYILAYYQSAPATLAAGFLHDVMEDCGVTYQELKTTFNDDVADIVQAVTKIKQLPDVSREETSASTHRKLILAMAKDIRGVIVKLCDRLHNMRTLQYMSPEKQQRVSKETLDVYAPLAHRLGMGEIKNELENLSLFYLNNREYNIVESLVEEKLKEKEDNIAVIINNIKGYLDKNNLPYRIFGRNKHIYSVYKKMYIKHTPFEQIFDLQAIRIVTMTKLQCYEILGIIHTIYKPIPGRFKDYIAMPKSNMYQSLHTTVFDDSGDLFEIQIRTEEMDYVAERGIAAHWIYKENTGDNISKAQELSEKQLSWLRDLIKLNEENEDNSDVEYMKQIQKDIFEASIYVLSPKGKIIDLPAGSTPIDFAYKIHSAVGNSCVGALVNKVMVPLQTELKSGDIVEIKTNKNSYPSEDWLSFVKTNTAKNQIKKYLLKKQDLKQSSDEEALVKKGHKMLEDAIDERKINKIKAFNDIEQIKVLRILDVKSVNQLYVQIAQKAISPAQVLVQVYDKNLDVQGRVDELNKKKISFKQKKYKENILIKGASGIKIETAVCCHPIPGDKIVGYITRGSGIKVHRIECPNIQNEKDRLIEATWADVLEEDTTYPVKLEIISYDRGNLVIDLMGLISTLQIRIDSITAKSHYENKTATMGCIVYVKNIDTLNILIGKIKQINGVIEVIRKNK